MIFTENSSPGQAHGEFLFRMIKRRLKKEMISITSDDKLPRKEFKKVCNTLRENKVMVITEKDGIYIRLAGDENNGYCFMKEPVRVVKF